MALSLVGGIAIAPGCSLGQGQGRVEGTLNVPDCWAGSFDLKPTFFAAVPYRNGLQIRIQSGGDYQTFSDGLSILVDDIQYVRGDATSTRLGLPLRVSLPPSVVPPGVPISADPNPPIVHIAVYLQRSCRTQNVALYAVDRVALAPDGSCNEKVPQADSVCREPSPPASPVGRSTITFTHIFSGNVEEPQASERLTEATFDIYLADPREGCAGGLGPPPPCRGHLTGAFSFYFERGRPGQPFP